MSNIFASDILKGQIALVTGASRGIGAAIAKSLASAGATVIGAATIKTALGASGRGTVLDIASDESVQALITDLNIREESPTIVVNNAGITKDNLLLRMKYEEWDAVLSTNLSGVFRVCKAVLRDMIKMKKGRIINIASVVGLMGNAGQVNYAAAKAGIIGFSKSLAREVGTRNITVNVVAPGIINTDMTRILSEKQRLNLINQVPLNSLGEAQDIANSVVFLASDAAAYITGETLNVNGGILMD
jgi:3-oxoacyl-[acyl-carrier protein] reductase